MNRRLPTATLRPAISPNDEHDKDNKGDKSRNQVFD